MTAHLGYGGGGGFEISADEVAPLLGIELRGNTGRADEITEHHRDIAALATGLSRGGDRRWRCGRDWLWRDGCATRRGSCLGGRGWYVLLDVVDVGYRAQHFAAITEEDAKLFQVLIGQFAKDREINAVFSKTLRVLGHAELFEPVGNLLHRGPLRILRYPRWTDRIESLPC